MMPSETDKSFVENMLKSAKEKREAKPQAVTDNVSIDEIEKVTQGLRDKWQKKG